MSRTVLTGFHAGLRPHLTDSHQKYRNALRPAAGLKGSRRRKAKQASYQFCFNDETNRLKPNNSVIETL
jgi:hypothetical protein